MVLAYSGFYIVGVNFGVSALCVSCGGLIQYAHAGGLFWSLWHAACWLGEVEFFAVGLVFLLWPVATNYFLFFVSETLLYSVSEGGR